MSSSVDHERKWVGELYPGRGWKKKVSKMSDSQILAIYIREHQKPSKPKPKQDKESNPDAEF